MDMVPLVFPVTCLTPCRSAAGSGGDEGHHPSAQAVSRLFSMCLSLCVLFLCLCSGVCTTRTHHIGAALHTRQHVISRRKPSLCPMVLRGALWCSVVPRGARGAPRRTLPIHHSLCQGRGGPVGLEFAKPALIRALRHFNLPSSPPPRGRGKKG